MGTGQPIKRRVYENRSQQLGSSVSSSSQTNQQIDQPVQVLSQFDLFGYSEQFTHTVAIFYWPQPLAGFIQLSKKWYLQCQRKKSSQVLLEAKLFELELEPARVQWIFNLITRMD